MVLVVGNGGAGVSMDLQTLLMGRDTRFYKGHLAKLNLIIVSDLRYCFVTMLTCPSSSS